MDRHSDTAVPAVLKDPVLRKLQKRLARLELEHLRQLAVDLQAQLEDAQYAAENADFWCDHATNLQRQLNEEQPDVAIGLTQTGSLILMPPPGLAS